jgi:hypothetical protein
VGKIWDCGDFLEVVHCTDQIGAEKKESLYPVVRRYTDNGERRLDSLTRTQKTVRRLIKSATSNQGEIYFLTATFAADITNYDEALGYWKQFQRRLQSEFSGVSYIAIAERQSGDEKYYTIRNRRKENPNYQGRNVWHFHALVFGLPSDLNLLKTYGWELNSEGTKKVPVFYRLFREMWGQGRFEIKPVDRSRGIRRLVGYLSGYITKALDVPPRRKIYFVGGDFKRPTVRQFADKLGQIIIDGLKAVWRLDWSKSVWCSESFKEYQFDFFSRCS